MSKILPINKTVYIVAYESENSITFSCREIESSSLHYYPNKIVFLQNDEEVDYNINHYYPNNKNVILDKNIEEAGYNIYLVLGSKGPEHYKDFYEKHSFKDTEECEEECYNSSSKINCTARNIIDEEMQIKICFLCSCEYCKDLENYEDNFLNEYITYQYFFKENEEETTVFQFSKNIEGNTIAISSNESIVENDILKYLDVIWKACGNFIFNNNNQISLVFFQLGISISFKKVEKILGRKIDRIFYENSYYKPKKFKNKELFFCKYENPKITKKILKNIYNFPICTDKFFFIECVFSEKNILDFFEEENFINSDFKSLVTDRMFVLLEKIKKRDFFEETFYNKIDKLISFIEPFLQQKIKFTLDIEYKPKLQGNFLITNDLFEGFCKIKNKYYHHIIFTCPNKIKLKIVNSIVDFFDISANFHTIILKNCCEKMFTNLINYIFSRYFNTNCIVKIINDKEEVNYDFKEDKYKTLNFILEKYPNIKNNVESENKKRKCLENVSFLIKNISRMKLLDLTTAKSILKTIDEIFPNDHDEEFIF